MNRSILLLLLRSIVISVRFLILLFLGLGFGFGLLLGKHDLIGKAQLHCLLCIKPGLVRHQLGDFVSGKAGLCHIGVEDALLDLVQCGDRFFHRSGIAHRNGHGIVHHNHGDRRHHHPVTCHCHHRRRACRDRVDLHGDSTRVIADHGVHLSRGKHIAARAVDPDGHIAVFCVQFFPELLRGYAVRPDGFLVNRSFQPEDAAAVVSDPTPKLSHSRFPPSFPTRLGFVFCRAARRSARLLAWPGASRD